MRKGSRGPTTYSVGDRYNRLEIIEVLAHNMARCKCDCGNETTVRRDSLRNGNTKSCGCLHDEGPAVGPNTSHGMRHSSEYSVWCAVKQRCLNPNHPEYADYGGRGITICDRWRDSFESFYADMGARPTLAHSIDRINNDGSYEPGNCRWATKIEQASNRRDRRGSGVFASGNGYIARVQRDHERYYLGYFTSEVDAIDAAQEFKTWFRESGRNARRGGAAREEVEHMFQVLIA